MWVNFELSYTGRRNIIADASLYLSPPPRGRSSDGSHVTISLMLSLRTLQNPSMQMRERKEKKQPLGLRWNTNRRDGRNNGASNVLPLPEDLRKLLIWEVLLHNGGICNGYITKRCLRNSRNVLYNDIVLWFLMIKDESNKISYGFCPFF